MKGPEFVETASGDASIETYTVMHDRRGATKVILFGRDNQNRRFIANTPNDPELMSTITTADFLRVRGKVKTNAAGVNMFDIN